MTNTCQKLNLLLWKNWKTNTHHKCRLVVTLITPMIFALLVLLVHHLQKEAEKKSPKPGGPGPGGSGPGGPRPPNRMAPKELDRISKNSAYDYKSTGDKETVKYKRGAISNSSKVKTPVRRSERADAAPSLLKAELEVKFAPELDGTNNQMVAKYQRKRRETHPPESLPGLMLGFMAWLTCSMGFICCCTMVVKSIASEKEYQIKETLKIMGMPYRIHWSAWFIISMIFIVIPSIVVVIIYYFCFEKANPIIVFILLILFGAALTCFSFMLSTFFDKANSAALFAQVIYEVCIVIHMACNPQLDNMPLVAKMFLCLSFIGAFGFGLRIVGLYEFYSDGLTLENVWTPPGYETMTMGYVWLMLILDSLIYLLIALYVEQVSPGEYGRSQPWNFCFLKSYWKSQEQTPEPVLVRRISYHPDSHEIEPDNAQLGIRTLNLTKVYGPKHKPAVENLNLNVYKNQITVLLGQSGAGKTTTISMLIGMTKPSRGTAEVNGYDIVKNIGDAQRSLGFCPQHNILFEELTVRDHLRFYCKLKGLSGNELDGEINQYLLKINLKDKEKNKPSMLSGGMLRKLSVCLALCGRSQVVLLDEPSAGIDPSARRALWDLLQSERIGRTILLSTQFMDEADVLGDRIAIMSDGRLQCSGTPFFLKKRFGAGYRLVVVKGDRCDVDGITKLLKGHIADLKLESNVGSELGYHLDESAASKFEPMLADLEQNGQKLGVISFGLSLTTMEDVFLKVGERSNRNLPALKTHEPEMSGDVRMSVLKKYLLENREKGRRLRDSKLRALFLKKLIILERGWIAYLCLCLVPALLLILGIIVERSSDNDSKGKSTASGGVVSSSVGYFGVPIAACYFILFPVKERAVMSKHLQFLSGAEVYLFWGVHFVFDFIAFLPIWISIIIVLAAFQEEHYSTAEELGRLFAVFICYACAILPLTYLCSFFFKSSAAGYVGMFYIHLCTGFLFFLILSVLRSNNKDDICDVLEWIFLLFPPFCIVLAIENLKVYGETEEICEKSEALCPKKLTGDHFQWELPGIGKPILFLLLMGAVFFIILLMADYLFFQRIITACANLKRRVKKRWQAENESEEIDDDVLKERERILSTSNKKLEKKYTVVLREVSKYYGNFLAVNRISVGVERGECFGLLGVNGAGKTTTFKMMTGALSISEGEGYLEGLSLKKDVKKIQKFIGYCPQYDALIDVMTPVETILMICLLRGIPRKTISRTIKKLLEELNLTQYKDQQVKKLSGGNKRKLSAAVSLVGNPPVLFLDEPSTGMDPLSKRELWNAIIKSRDKGSSVILTSHSMEECEALCTRLVIMVNGSFRCIGSVQYLKGKFAEGTTLTIKENLPPTTRRPSRTSASNPIKIYVNKHFPGAILKEEYKGLLKYYMPKSNLKWSQMFGLMEKAKKKFDIEYSVGQTSLEQVFLTLTMSQMEEE